MEKLQSEQSFENDAEQLLQSAIISNLKMSYEERIEAHENARQLAEDLRLAGQEVKKSLKRPKDLQAVKELRIIQLKSKAQK